MRSPVIRWLYRLSTFDFGTNLGYSLTGAGDAVVLVLMASVGVVRVVIVVGAAAVEIVTARTVVGGGAAGGLPEHPVSIKAKRASSAGNLTWFIPSTPNPECRQRRCSPGRPQPARCRC